MSSRKIWACGLILLLICVMGFAARSAVVSVYSNTTVPFRPSIIIDAGHGGFDGGAVANGTVEKDLNLAVSRKLEQLALLYGFEVIMVRTEDVAVNDETKTDGRGAKSSDIHNRLALARQNPHAVFISIHQNKFPRSGPWGAQVFYGKKNENSRLLAQSVQDSIREQLQPDNKREIKQAGKNLYILYNSENPAILVECGFLSNPDECEKLNDPEYQQNLAFAILSALIGHYQTGETLKT